MFSGFLLYATAIAIIMLALYSTVISYLYSSKVLLLLLLCIAMILFINGCFL